MSPRSLNPISLHKNVHLQKRKMKTVCQRRCYHINNHIFKLSSLHHHPFKTWTVFCWSNQICYHHICRMNKDKMLFPYYFQKSASLENTNGAHFVAWVELHSSKPQKFFIVNIKCLTWLKKCRLVWFLYVINNLLIAWPMVVFDVIHLYWFKGTICKIF